MLDFGNVDECLMSRPFKLLIIVMSLCIFSIVTMSIITDDLGADVGDTFVIDGINYVVTAEGNTNEVEVISYTGSITEYFGVSPVIHENNSYAVTSIGESAFKRCDSLISVKVPESVKSIGKFAFNGCTGLKELTIPISLDAASSSDIWDEFMSLEEVVFTPGKGLGYDYGTAMGVGDNVKYTPWKKSKDSLTTVIFEVGITYIGRYLLYECDKVTTIIIPSTVKSIGDSAFEDCTSIASLTLPEGLTHIQKSAFEGCSSLSSLTLPTSIL